MAEQPPHPQHGLFVTVESGDGSQILAKRFVLQVSGPEMGDNPGYAVMDMTESHARWILKCVSLVRDLRNLQDGLAHVAYYDYSIDFFDNDEDDFKSDGEHVCRTDGERVYIDGDTVHWEAYAKHSDDAFSTDQIKVADIEQALRELAQRRKSAVSKSKSGSTVRQR